jgi:hypothetical protein
MICFKLILASLIIASVLTLNEIDISKKELFQIPKIERKLLQIRNKRNILTSRRTFKNSELKFFTKVINVNQQMLMNLVCVS